MMTTDSLTTLLFYIYVVRMFIQGLFNQGQVTKAINYF